MSLISVQKIAKKDEYKIIFDEIDAFLYNKVYRWRIGLAKVHGGLYYLQTMVNSLCTRKENDSKVVTVASKHKKNEIIFLHKRLGLQSFFLLKNMYPSLFKNLPIDTLIYNVCQLAKIK